MKQSLCKVVVLGLALASFSLFPATDAEAGAIPGPRTIPGTVGKDDRRDTFSIRFRGGEQALLIVNNQSNRGDIDLYVVDDNGRVVARDRRSANDASVSFFVPRTHTYQVIVHCYHPGGGAPLRYLLTTN